MTTPAETQDTNVDAAELRRRRTDAGLTQRQLAAAVGMSVYQVSNLELGKVNASDDDLAGIAAALGCQVSDLHRPEAERAAATRRQRAGRYAAHLSWAYTPNRAERTAAARAASPVSYEYWVQRLTSEGVVREKDIPAAARNAHSAYMTQMRRRRTRA